MSAKNVGSRVKMKKAGTKSPIHKACQQTPTTKLLHMARNQVHGSRRRTVVVNFPASKSVMWTVTNTGTKKTLNIVARNAESAVQLALKSGLAKKVEKLVAVEWETSA
jgi:hypothetical protein